MRSDKMQMSAVPQTSEHVLISSNTVKDIVLPYGAIVEDIKAVLQVVDPDAGGVATGAEIDLGTTASANYYKAAAIACDSTGSVGVQISIDGAKMMTAVPADRTIRITPNSFGTTNTAKVYVWVNYRFAPNDYPTQLV
jgi:hypothetical protein